MNRIPTRLQADLASWDSLIDEVMSFNPTVFPPESPLSELRLFGLSIEFTSEPSFNVI
jgi:hypothetical protein